jgi:hypothetical protein
MSTLSSTAHWFWVISLLSALLAGVALGFIRAWWFMLLGVAVPVAMAVVSRLASNDSSLSISQDGLSWRALILAVAIEVALLFFFSFAVGARLRTFVEFLRRRAHRTPTNLSGPPG